MEPTVAEPAPEPFLGSEITIIADGFVTKAQPAEPPAQPKEK